MESEFYPSKTKSAQETTKSLRKFSRPEENPRYIFTDSSPGHTEACEELNWNHERKTPHRSEGMAERDVRRVKEGTSSILVQSGLEENWWAEAMECYCYLRNVQDLLADDQTPCECRFNSPIDGPIFQTPPYISKRPRWSASVRHKSLSWDIHGLRLQRG